MEFDTNSSQAQQRTLLRASTSAAPDETVYLGLESLHSFHVVGEKTVVSVGSGYVAIWEDGNEQPTYSVIRAPSRVFADLSKDGRWLITADDRGRVELTNLQNGELVYSVYPSTRQVWDVVYESGEVLVSQGSTVALVREGETVYID